MNGMTELSLQDATEFIVDCLHKTAPTQENGYPLIRTPNIGKGRFDLTNVKRISENTYDIWTTRAVPQRNDLILAREAPAGNVAIIKSDEPYCLGQRTVHIRVRESILDPMFLTYFLLAPKQQALLLKNQIGVHVGHVNMRDIRKLPLLDLPSLKEQKKLASILSAYDDLIENNRRRIQLLEESARLLYKEWFVHLRFPGHKHTKIIDGVPEGWERKPLGELCYQYKKTIKPSEVSPDTPYIGLGNMPRKSITLSKWETSEKVTSNKYIFQKGDILFGKIRPYFHKVGFALCNGITSSDSVVLRVQKKIYYCYVLAYVSSNIFIQLASKTCREGAKMPRADWKYLEKHGVVVPSEMLLMEFSEQQSEILKQLKTLALYNQKLAQARDLLLPRLMNGEIEV